ncbi:AbgT family transporter [Nocardia sp. NEAU-G5]|uniref:AbgT family transporter n=1 Tax=Nocardia albiluteola TaxID=2842303 RepID=A0ABS6B809_9NOCA|nr:AbgT family transporter [Nocardia albiluteola]MBU3066399.1 AbgT family transporter [Nocardia albiluteola]
MSATETEPQAITPPSRLARAAFRSLALIEQAGNKLPDPFWLFWLLAGLVVVLSAILAAADVSAVLPASHSVIKVHSLLSKAGLALIIQGGDKNFTSFPPIATILVVGFGIAIAEQSGMFAALLHRMVARVPGRYLTFVLALTAMVSHIAGDAAYVMLIPLGALVYRAAGRSPMLGCIVAYVSISAGFNASPALTPTDILLSNLSTAAARTIDPHYVVTPVANYFFGVASSLLMAVVITVVADKFLARRPDLAADAPDTEPDTAERAQIEPTQEQRRALRVTGLVALGFLALLVAVMIPQVSPLRGKGGGILDSPLFSGMSLVLFVFFALLGTVYGRMTRTFTAPRDVVDSMITGTKAMASTLVLFFAISQFLACFKWTNISDILAVRGADALRALHLNGWLLLLGIAVLVSLINLLITSGSALWALIAPILVPLLMLLGIHPETTQAIYRVADSVTKCITPMSPFFVMAVGFIRQYRQDAGLGTLAAFTLPIAVVAWVVWVGFFLAWYLLGIPFGLG